MNVHVRQLMKIISLSAPTVSKKDLARVQSALERVDPYFDADKARCELVAGYLLGTAEGLEELTRDFEYEVSHLINALNPIGSWNDVDQRLLDLITHSAWWCYLDDAGEESGRFWELYGWMRRHLSDEPPDADRFGVFAGALRHRGVEEDQIVRHTLGWLSGVLVIEGRATSAGRFLLDRATALDEVVAVAETQQAVAALASLLLTVDPARFRARRDQLVQAAGEGEAVGLAEAMLDAEEEATLALSLLEKAPPGAPRFRAAQLILQRQPERAADARAMAQAALTGMRTDRAMEVVDWLLAHHAEEALPDVQARLLAEENDYHRLELAALAKKHLGDRALPLLLRTLHYPFDSKTIYGDMDHAKYVERSLALLEGLDLGKHAEEVWRMAEHPTKRVRDAASRVLPTLGGEVIAPATRLLGSKKADIRAVGAKILIGQEAWSVLASALPHERSSKVKTIIEAALPAGAELPQTEGPPPSDQTSAHLIAAEKDKPSQKKPVRAWLEASKLPRLFYQDGRPVELPVVRRLFYRQSREKQPHPAPDVAPILADVDLARSGEFGLAVFNLFVANRADNKDKFCLVVAVMTGDARTLFALKKKIVEWPEVRRGKLSEFALGALAASSHDLALYILDGAARQLRTFRRIQSDVARTLLLEAAEVRGLSRERLVDRVTPRHGFSGRTREVGQPHKRFTVSVGADFKISYRDASGKPVKSLSKTIPEVERAQVATFAKNLRDLVKMHRTRLADAMLSEQSWPAEAFRTLFLEHPILWAFAASLVFCMEKEGAQPLTFRALEDGTLTDVEDEEVSLEGSIRLLHPARTSEAVVVAWVEHFRDYEVAPPFPQLSRPREVEGARPESRVDRTFEGRPWDTFERQRYARRFGWKALTVYEEHYTACFKTFPGGDQDIDVVLLVDQYENVVVGHYFARYQLETVESGAFHFPESEDDPRLLPLSQVPPIIYAEAQSELAALTQAG